MAMHLVRGLFLVALVALAACDGNGPHGLRAELDAARDRWAAAGLSAYAVSQRRSCFCPPPAGWTVVVADGQPLFIDSVESFPRGGESGRALELRALDSAMSVEAMFDWIDARIETAARIDVAFDPALGFPASVSVDPIAGQVDDEIAWEMSNVVAVGACTEIGCADGLQVVLVPAGGRVAAGDYEITATPPSAAGAACAFTVTVGGSCSSTFCVQGAGCALPLGGPDRIQVTFPVLEGALDVTVSIDGSVVASESVEPVYTRSQPNGTLCPPVCWTAALEVAVP